MLPHRGLRESLRELHVTPDNLTREENDFLDTHGYLTLRGVLDLAAVRRMRDDLLRILRADGRGAGLPTPTRWQMEAVRGRGLRARCCGWLFGGVRIGSRVSFALIPRLKRRLAARDAASRPLDGRGGLRSELAAMVLAEAHQEDGTHRLCNLVKKSALFDVCLTHPRVLAAVSHLLGSDFRLSSLNARCPLPSRGLQRLHADWERGVPPGKYHA